MCPLVLPTVKRCVSKVPAGGTWNLRDKRFWRPGSNLKIWSVVNFDNVNEHQMHEFLRTLVSNLHKLGKHARPYIKSYLRGVLFCIGIGE